MGKRDTYLKVWVVLHGCVSAALAPIEAGAGVVIIEESIRERAAVVAQGFAGGPEHLQIKSQGTNFINRYYRFTYIK